MNMAVTSQSHIGERSTVVPEEKWSRDITDTDIMEYGYSINS